LPGFPKPAAYVHQGMVEELVTNRIGTNCASADFRRLEAADRIDRVSSVTGRTPGR